MSETYGAGNATLRGAAIKLLPTPMARTQGGSEVSSENREGGLMLEESVKLLPTPRSNDGSRESPRRSNPGFGPTLEQLAGLLSSGETSDLRSGVGRPPPGLRLSPWFVEWMIGLPQGWSDPDCQLSAMEFKSRLERSSVATSSSSREAA
jgi:hypothetical protein